jgi:hypothetical protein
MKIRQPKSNNHEKNSHHRQKYGTNWRLAIKKLTILIFVKFWHCMQWIFLKLGDPRWLVAFVTVVYAIFVILQWREMRENNRIISNTFIYSQRASVVFEGMDVMPYSNMNDTGMPGVHIVPNWINNGNTPTKNLQLSFFPPKATKNSAIQILVPKQWKRANNWCLALKLV